MKSNTKLVFALLLSALMLAYACNDYTGGTDGKPKGRPDIALTYPELVSMLQYYDATRKDPLENINKREDARVHFLEIDQLKAYIAYVEKEARKKKIKVTGINFISAAYPDNYPVAKNRDYQTIVMMPATTINGVEGISFDPLKSAKGEPKSLREILANYYNYTWYYDNVTFNKSANRNKSNDDFGDELSSGGNRLRPSPPH